MRGSCCYICARSFTPARALARATNHGVRAPPHAPAAQLGLHLIRLPPQSGEGGQRGASAAATVTPLVIGVQVPSGDVLQHAIPRADGAAEPTDAATNHPLTAIAEGLRALKNLAHHLQSKNQAVH